MLSMALLLGNAQSPFMQGDGGKGVATIVGIIAFCCGFEMVLLFICMWGLIAYCTKKPFLASLVSVFSVLLWFWLIKPHLELATLLLGAFLWSVWRHRTNIKNYFNLSVRCPGGF
jgi:glycerol-3-phosphate acyltransferase PlsY